MPYTLKKQYKRPDGFYRWCNMRRRCTQPNNKDWSNYGGRGITVCDRWLGREGFKNYIADVGSCPVKGYTLDRIDNDGNYEPSNVQWADRRQQNGNRRNNNKDVGVCWWKPGNRWMVRLNKKLVGYYFDYDEAVQARKDAEAKLCHTN